MRVMVAVLTVSALFAGAGRMLNTPMPEGDTVDVDFNLAYNPPCAFTPYATCPLPPKEDQLPFPVTAGEKRYRHGHS